MAIMREGWKEVEIQKVALKVTSGGTPLRKKSEYYGGNIPWVKTKQVNYNRIYDSEEYITELGLQNSSAKLIPENSIIIAMYGDGNTAGRCAINKVPVTTNQACCNIILNQDLADYNYIYYYLSTQYDKLVSLKSGGGQQNLNAQTLKEFKINLPLLETQKKIASILSSYDDLIENNLKRIKILEEMAQQTYEEWFVRMRFPGYETATINPATGLPEGWEKVKLGDCCEKIFDGTHDSPKPKDTGYKLITGKHLQKGKVDFESAYYISEEDHLKIKKRSGLEKGDIMFSNIGTIGNLSMVTEDFEYSCKNMIVFRPYKDFQYYLYTYLFNENNKNKMVSEAAGSTQKFLSLSYIRGFEDVLPPIELIKSFNSFSKSLFVTIKNLQNQNQRLREARDILLPRLMMGIVEV